jgi:hypothetical protein
VRRYAVSLVLLLALIGLWELATPLLAAPDEPQHVTKAAAVARGQWVGRGGPIGPRTHVTLPAGFAEVDAFPRCFAFQPRRPASCAPAVTAHGGPPVDVTTTAGRYPPAYYGLVGLPTLMVRGVASDRVARLVSGLLCALLLAAATAWAGGDLLALAVPVAVTPMVLFLGAVVNPSGVEVAAAAASWVGLLRLVRDPDQLRRGRLIGVTAVICALILTRPISPLWALMILLTVAVTTPRSTFAGLVRQRAMQVCAGVVALVAVAQTSWVVLAQSTRLFGTPQHVTRAAALGKVLTFTHVHHLASQMVGRFGWLDTGAPLLTLLIWAGLALGALVIGLLSGSRRLRLALAAALLAAVLVPALLEASSFPRIGYWWQGRYSMPYWIGLPFLALVGRSVRARWRVLLSGVVAGAVVIGQLDAFSRTLARYTVGVGHGIALANLKWHPPLAPLPLMMLFAVTVAGWAVWCAWLATSRSRPTSIAHSRAGVAGEFRSALP